MPNESTSPIHDIVGAVKAMPSMRQLQPEKFAEKEGWADRVARNSAIKSTQLRKIFHYVKDLKREFQKSEKGFNRAKVAMLMPMLAYAKGRNLIPEDFYELMSLCFGQQRCSSVDDFNSAADFLEAIMAYHKYHHPKD